METELVVCGIHYGYDFASKKAKLKIGPAASNHWQRLPGICRISWQSCREIRQVAGKPKLTQNSHSLCEAV